MDIGHITTPDDTINAKAFPIVNKLLSNSNLDARSNWSSMLNTAKRLKPIAVSVIVNIPLFVGSRLFAVAGQVVNLVDIEPDAQPRPAIYLSGGMVEL